ncbi:MAG: hypothetical protein KBT67_00510 [bacterium]|nr:hypothetical protein [Candidatus Limimorpha caballi]
MKAKSRKRWITIGVIVFVILVLPVSLFLLSEWLFPSFWGSYNLGNDLYMMEWDGNCRIIVYNNHVKTRTCFSGAYVIPNLEVDPTIRVITAKSNKHWVIVEAYKNYDKDDRCYFVIDKSFDLNGLDWQKDRCDSIIQSHIILLNSVQDLEKKLFELDIKLHI